MPGTAPKASSSKSTITRVLWKEIKRGDRRKFSATSNDQPSGGGARDLRFRGGDHLAEIMLAMFPRECTVARRRNGAQTDVCRYEGEFCWIEQLSDGSSVERSEVACVEPPTTSRPNEWRITRVHTYDVFTDKLPPHPATGRLLLLLIQTTSQQIWPAFADEATIRTGSGWLPAFRQHVVGCLDLAGDTARSIFGYFEVDTGREYCNA